MAHGNSTTENTIEYLDLNGLQLLWQKIVAQSARVPAATPSSIGGVIVGNGLSIDNNGVLSVAIENTSFMKRYLLELEQIPGTVQSITFNNGDIQNIRHRQGGATVRTDTFTFTETTVTELRRLSTGETLTIETNLNTLQTTTTYAE